MPEVGGPIDPNNEAHDLVMSVFGGMSKGERNRVKIRVRTAMAAQAQVEGRLLGGRPPYGYRLADAGPHPNKAHAAWGPPRPPPRTRLGNRAYRSVNLRLATGGPFGRADRAGAE